MTRALITGIGGTRSIAVLNALRLLPEPVYIVGSDVNYFNAGSYQCNKAYTVPLAADPAYFETLCTIIDQENIDIVYGTVEAEVSQLAGHKAELERRYSEKVIVPEPDVLALCFDKYKTQQFLRDGGFTAIPCIYGADTDAVAEFAAAQGLPLIRKPVAGYGSRGLSVITTSQELAEVAADGAYVIQRFIPNDDSEKYYNTELNEYTAEIFVNADRSIAGGIIIKRALHAGETVAGYRMKDDDTLVYLQKVATALAITGPCNFQYRKHEGEVYIFEINPLYSGTTFIRARYGFNSVGMAIRSFVQAEHGRLGQDELQDKYFIRYLQETFIEPAQLQELRQNKQIGRED